MTPETIVTNQPVKGTPDAPLPWQFCELSHYIITAVGEPVASPPDGYDEAQWLADAAFIIRAVNCHAELLAALKGVTGLAALRPGHLADYKAAVEEARAVIAKAERS